MCLMYIYFQTWGEAVEVKDITSLGFFTINALLNIVLR